MFPNARQPGMMFDRAASIDLSDRDQRLRHAAAAPGERPRQEHRDPRPAPPDHRPVTATRSGTGRVRTSRPRLPRRTSPPSPPRGSPVRPPCAASSSVDVRGWPQDCSGRGRPTAIPQGRGPGSLRSGPEPSPAVGRPPAPALACGPLQGGSQIPLFLTEAAHPIGVPAFLGMGLRRLRQAYVPVGVTVADGDVLRGGGQALQHVLTDGLEHVDSRFPVGSPSWVDRTRSMLWSTGVSRPSRSSLSVSGPHTYPAASNEQPAQNAPRRRSVPRCTLHDLRHLAVTTAISEGVYAHLTRRTAHQAVDAIATALDREEQRRDHTTTTTPHAA